MSHCDETATIQNHDHGDRDRAFPTPATVIGQNWVEELTRLVPVN